MHRVMMVVVWYRPSIRRRGPYFIIIYHAHVTHHGDIHWKITSCSPAHGDVQVISGIDKPFTFRRSRHDIEIVVTDVRCFFVARNNSLHGIGKSIMLAEASLLNSVLTSYQWYNRANTFYKPICFAGMIAHQISEEIFSNVMSMSIIYFIINWLINILSTLLGHHRKASASLILFAE